MLSPVRALLRPFGANCPVLHALLFVAVTFGLHPATPANAARILSYNVLNFGDSELADREADLRMVIGGINPDLIVVQEITHGVAGAATFLSDVLEILEPGEWAMAPFVVGPDTNNACYYRVSEFDFLSHTVLPTALRNHDGWEFRADGYSADDAKLRVYSVHLKASQGSDNVAKRTAEAAILRTHLNGLPAGTNFIVAGDTNIYTSTEGAWAQLTGSQADNDGRSFDPINRVGNWHNNASFADVHTQSPRSTQFGGGAHGGVDDRFDFVLRNDDLGDGNGMDYIPGSHTIFGQDGLHFNGALTDLPANAVVSASMAQAIHDAADHMPVFYDVQLPAKMSVSGTLAFGDVLQGSTPTLALTLSNPAIVPADELDWTVVAPLGFLVSGSATGAAAAGASNFPSIAVLTTTPGALLGNVSVTGDAPDTPSALVAASATVLAPSSPSLDAGVLKFAQGLDFGAHDVGAFAALSVSVHNFEYGVLQALLEVYDVQITGPDAARFSVNAFSTTDVGGTALDIQLAFDDAMASVGNYSATLAIQSRDDTAIFGSQTRGDLFVALTAEVTDTATPVPGQPIWVTRLHVNRPNPFNPRTEIHFDLARASTIVLTVFDVQGRRIRSLDSGLREAGQHSVVWNGRDDSGKEASSGVYFYRLQTAAGEFTRRMVLVR